MAAGVDGRWCFQSLKLRERLVPEVKPSKDLSVGDHSRGVDDEDVDRGWDLQKHMEL